MIPRWLPQNPGMTAGTPSSAPAKTSTPGDADEIGARQQHVLMAEEQRIDARRPRERERGILLAGQRRAAARNPGMAERDHEIDGFAQGRHIEPRGFGDADGRDPAGEMAVVPLHDLRRRETDDADAQDSAGRRRRRRTPARRRARAGRRSAPSAR